MKSTDIYLICGYFGVGKTSYINKLLKSLHGNIYVMQNELGETALETDGIHSDAVIGGCVCCSLAGELIAGLERYAEAQADHVIIELPSTAELSKLIQYCCALEKKRGLHFLMHSTTLIDCSRFKSHLRNFGKFYSDQIMNADKLILTRTVSMKPETREYILSKITDLTPDAEVEISSTIYEE